MKKINKTKLPKITQLPSGSFTTKIFVSKDDTGKRIYKSITSSDYDEVVELAARFKLDKKHEKTETEKPVDKRTVGEAIDSYISTKDAVLSPATICEYKRVRKAYLQDIMPASLSDLTQPQIQRSINEAARTLSPKSVRNIHGLLSATLSVYRPEMRLTTTLPRKEKPDIRIPTEDEMTQVFEYVRGTDMEVPIYLAAFCGMRRGEIAALDWANVNIKKRTIFIKEGLVRDEFNNYLRCKTKSTAGKRIIKILPFFADALSKCENKTGSVTQMAPYTIYDN